MTFARAIVLLMGLGACASARVEVGAAAQGGQVAYLTPALQKARLDFLGLDEGGGGDGGLGLDEPARLQGGPPTLLRLGVSLPQEQGTGWALVPSLALSGGMARAYLPEGLGILTDPIRIGVTAGMAEAQVMASRGGGGVFSYGAGVGVMQIVARADLQSALIDRVSYRSLTRPYAVASGSLGIVTGQVYWFGPDQTELRLGLARRF